MVESSHDRTGRLRPRLAPAALICACLTLGGCTSFSSYVSDHWPTWAGGMPIDVPPRPGEPGYAEFISHQEAKDEAATAAANKPGATPAVVTGPTGAVAAPAASPTAAAPAAGNVDAQPLSPDARRIDTQAAVQGGLY